LKKRAEYLERKENPDKEPEVNEIQCQQKAQEEIKDAIAEFFTSEIEFVKHVETVYMSKYDSRQWQNVSLYDFYVKFKKEEKQAAGIHNPANGKPWVKQYL